MPSNCQVMGGKCEPPITVTDDDLSGELFALALQANAGGIGWDEVMAEVFWWHELKSADLESINVNERDYRQS